MTRAALLLTATSLLILCGEPNAAARTPFGILQVEGLSFSETYFSQGIPRGIATYDDVFLGSGISVTGAAGIKWTKTSRKSFAILRILPTYGSRFGDVHSITWNEALSFRYSRLLRPKWTLSFSAGAQVMNFEEALYVLEGAGTLRIGGARG